MFFVVRDDVIFIYIDSDFFCDGLDDKDIILLLIGSLLILIRF